MKARDIILATGLLMLAVSACKPTEKGYRTAYEAAKNKRESVDPDMELMTGGHRLLEENATNWRVIGNDSLQLQHVMLRPAEGSVWPESGPYRLGVAMFKMDTNAKSLLKDLKEKGSLKPVIASDGKGQHYIIAGSATYVDSLGQVLTTFRKENPGFTYIGLTPPQPVILVGR